MYLILIDFRKCNGNIAVLTDNNEEIYQFHTIQEAREETKNNILCKSFDYKIVNFNNFVKQSDELREIDILENLLDSINIK